jgi:hypothetical protein
LVAVIGWVGVACSAWLLVTIVRHAGQAVYDLPPSAVLLGVGAAIGAVVGWSAIARSGDGVLLLGVLVAVLLVAGVVSILTIGALLLLGGAALATLVGRLARGRPRIDTRTLAAAVLGAGLAFPIAALVASDGPVVECRDDGGVSVRGSVFRGGGSSVGAGDASASETTGSMTAGGRTYTYRCSDGRLVEFDVRSGA